MRRTVTWLTIGFLIPGCFTGPSGVSLTLSASSRSVIVGDSVRFTVSAFNHGDARVQIGELCGPSFDVEIVGPGGDRTTALTVLLGSNGAFTCEQSAAHFVEPGKTTTLTVAWGAPAAGSYIARGGLRRIDGLTHRAKSIPIVVR